MSFNPFRLKIHWGNPNHPTEIRAWSGSLGFKRDGVPQPRLHCFISHEVARWFGVSYGRSGFIGLCRFGSSVEYRTTDAPRIGLVAAPDPASPPARGRGDRDG